MAAEEEKTKRQRFYIELKHGETTIVSWKKLLRKAKEKDQCGPHLPSSSTALETSRSVMDGKHDGGLYKDSIIRNRSAKHINKAISSDCMQPRKGRVAVTKIECEKNDGHSSIKHAGWESLSAKATSKSSNLLDETFKHSNSPAVVKDHQSKDLQAFRMHAPVLTYSKKAARFCSKSKCPPLNAVDDDASMFPLNKTHNVLQKTQKISSEKKKVGVGGNLSDVVHQNFEGRCVPVKNSPTSGILLHDKISSKSWHNDKSGGSWGLIDAISPGYKSSLKDSTSTKASENCYINDVISPGYKPSLNDSLVRLWPEGVMDHHTLTEAMSRAKSSRAIADKNPVRNMVDDVSRNFSRIPCQKRKVTDSSKHSNPIPYCPRKIAPKKALIEQPDLQSKSSCPFPKNVKLTFKQKQHIPEKTNMKVRFLLKQEHETINSNAQVTKDALDHSRTPASLTCNQPFDVHILNTSTKMSSG